MQHPHWLKLLILTSSLLSFGCKGTLPIRPKVDICMVSIQDDACLCSKPDGEKYVLAFGENGCDKHVAIDPVHFNQLAEYILKLEQMAQKQCGLRSSPGSDAVRELYQGYQALEAMR